MAVCIYCDQEMTDDETKSCISMPVGFLDDVEMPPVRYAGSNRCHDCNIEVGGLHHPGCDMERCPRCGGQLISCNCKKE
jgi:hypothetical protein